MRDGELHLGSFSELKLSNETFDNVHTEKIVKEKPIASFNVADNIGVRAFIVQMFEPRFFNVCPECKKKANAEGENFVCVEHGTVMPEKRTIMNLVIDDGTESIRAVLFHDAISGLGIEDVTDAEKITAQKESLLGKEMFFSGNVRMNSYFNNPELIIDNVKEVNLDELIGKLEKNAA